MDDSAAFASKRPVFVQLGERRVPARYYVYTHRGLDGRLFYIGKGTGMRAWSTDRDALWRHFVERDAAGVMKSRSSLKI